MHRYVLKRLLLAIPTLFGITIVTFLIVHLAPGDPAQQALEGVQDPKMSIEIYEQLKKHWGLDKPLHEQYVLWVSKLVRLDFGNSFHDGRKVSDKILERLHWTMSLAVLSMVIGLAFSIPIGLYSASKQNGWFDTIVSTILYALYSVPNYVMAMVLIVAVVMIPIEWLPIRGATSDGFSEMSFGGKAVDLAKHFFLITFCYSYGVLAFQSRFVRGNLLEVVRQDYVRTARAKGLDERTVILKHAFRNTLIPLATFLGLIFPIIVSGSVILEVMFNWPGIGRLFFESILQRDYPTVMALSFVTAVLVLTGTLVADLSYALVDPRVRYD